MTWQPIAAGANGLVYYAFHRICMAAKGAERDECLRIASAAAAEVKAKMHILLSEPGPAVLSVPEGMVCRTWRTADGKVALLAANTTRKAVAGTVTLADGLPPQTVELLPLGHVFIDEPGRAVAPQPPQTARGAVPTECDAHSTKKQNKEIHT